MGVSLFSFFFCYFFWVEGLNSTKGYMKRWDEGEGGEVDDDKKEEEGSKE